MFLPPPQFAGPSQRSYAEAYAEIVATYRRSPTTSASSVIVLVAPDVDALCAARMLADLFKQDDIMHRIIPVSGMAALESQRNELLNYPELHTLVLLNMGAILELPSPEWFGDFNASLVVHVIDSARPQNLSSLFGGESEVDRVYIWDDGGANDLEEERQAWEALLYEPEPDSDTDSDLDSQLEDEDDFHDEEDERASGSSGKRRHGRSDEDTMNKRRRLENSEQPKRMSRDIRDRHSACIEKHYGAGTWHGQSASGTIYILATVLERVDNDLLWLAILGLTFQYTSSRISRDKYDQYHQAYYDEVARLNPPLTTSTSGNVPTGNPDDSTIRAADELRFTLFRHWTLYDAMYHSSYVANKLGIWRERGRKKLTGLLAKMGFSIPQTQQPYSHMDMDLKRQLRTKLEAIAPEYGLIELAYPSFTRSYGFRTQPLSAADMVEGLGALLEVSSGVKMEIEIEGARNGGEWFGGGKVWDARWREEDGENIPPAGVSNLTMDRHDPEKQEDNGLKKSLEWWVRNFWTAYDSLDDISRVREALSLAMSLHRAIIRQGSSIIDKQEIKTMNRHRVVILTQGPDLALFAHPGVLSRLALWLVEALRDKVGRATFGRSKKKCLPFVVACLDEKEGTFIVVGVTAALEFGDIRKNQFGLAFLDAKTRCNARTRHSSFDTSVLEINQADLSVFLETLCHETLV
ncbi:CDC45-like protein [Hysterangium stoloniferum]|nr:CDC45-like protein [Hysterangium stoloniferum]